MSCCRGHGKDFEDDNCVCAVLRNIADVQDQVDPENCAISCDKSIQALLKGIGPLNRPNTIPVMLFCDCKPFKGFGVRTVEGELECIETFLFRVNSVDDNCCAKLELLAVGEVAAPEEPGEPGVDIDADEFENPCDQLDGVEVTEIVPTGICMTVDLHCFCAVTCMEPIRLVRL